MIGRVKLSKEFMDERGDTGRCERRWRGSRWPWKKMSSAGDKSIAKELGGVLALSGTGAEEEWREIVKENS